MAMGWPEIFAALRQGASVGSLQGQLSPTMWNRLQFLDRYGPAAMGLWAAEGGGGMGFRPKQGMYRGEKLSPEIAKAINDYMAQYDISGPGTLSSYLKSHPGLGPRDWPRAAAGKQSFPGGGWAGGGGGGGFGGGGGSGFGNAFSGFGSPMGFGGGSMYNPFGAWGGNSLGNVADFLGVDPSAINSMPYLHGSYLQNWSPAMSFSSGQIPPELSQFLAQASLQNYVDTLSSAYQYNKAIEQYKDVGKPLQNYLLGMWGDVLGMDYNPQQNQGGALTPGGGNLANFAGALGNAFGQGGGGGANFADAYLNAWGQGGQGGNFADALSGFPPVLGYGGGPGSGGTGGGTGETGGDKQPKPAFQFGGMGGQGFSAGANTPNLSSLSMAAAPQMASSPSSMENMFNTTGGPTGFQGGVGSINPTLNATATGGGGGTAPIGFQGGQGSMVPPSFLGATGGGTTAPNPQPPFFKPRGVASNAFNPGDARTWGQFLAAPAQMIARQNAAGLEQLKRTLGPNSAAYKQAAARLINQSYGQIGGLRQNLAMAAPDALAGMMSQSLGYNPAGPVGAGSSALSALTGLRGQDIQNSQFDKTLQQTQQLQQDQQNNTLMSILGKLIGTGAGIAVSDPALKKDVVPHEKGLLALKNLETYDFTYNEKAGSLKGIRASGVMADEVKKKIPEAYTEVEVDGKRVGAVNYYSLLMTTINAVKELDKKVSKKGKK